MKQLPVMRYIYFLFFVLFCSCGNKQHADLILHNGKVYTVDSSFNVVQAFAVRDGKIIAAGSDASILNSYTADSVLDAHGMAVYPGFIDAHCHFVGYGRGLFAINLYDCKDWNEALERITAFAKAHPGEQWIRGRGWDQNKWPSRSFPDNTELNKLFPSIPVLLQRVDGHAAVANAVALALAHITPGQNIEGGVIETKNGGLTGMLVDNAVELVTKVIPNASKADYEKWLVAAQKNCFAQGLTTVTDCGLSCKEVRIIDTLQQQGKVLMRMYVMLSEDAATLQPAPYETPGDTLSNTAEFRRFIAHGPYKTDRLFVKGVKAYADGALGSRGACLLAPYTDKPEWNGFLLSPQSHFDSLAQMLVNTDFQLCVHAIGDSGNRIVLQVFNKYLKGKNDKRWRIEHTQVVNEKDFDLFGRASIIPSVQPTHATSDMYWAKDRLGEGRLKGAYAYQQLLQQNGWMPLGTDFPVEDISPIKTFYAAVFRRDAKGFPDGGFQMENALTREQAIRGMTIWAAKADFLDKEIGSIEVGKKADFVILDKDLMKATENEILNIKILKTYLGGKRVY